MPRLFIFFALIVPVAVNAITPTTAVVADQTELEALEITAVTNSVLYVVDVNENDGVANQNPATPTFYLWSNGATGWNNPCANYSDLGLVPAETCSAKTNVVMPVVDENFHVRVYDTSNAACYNAFADVSTNCAGEPYLDITGPVPDTPVASSSTTTEGILVNGFISLIFGLSVIIFLIMLFVSGYIYNSLIKPAYGR